jgi:hypothetical protein
MLINLSNVGSPSISLSNIGDPTIGIAVAPINQLNLAVLSSLPQLNQATVTLAGLHY